MTFYQRIVRITALILATLAGLALFGATSAQASPSSPPRHVHAETYPERLARLAREIRAHGPVCATEDGSGGPLPCRSGSHSGISYTILNGGIVAGSQRVIRVYADHVERDAWPIG